MVSPEFFDLLFVFLSVGSMIGFGYLYNKDHDKRKLMFLLAFFLIMLKHLSHLTGWWENNFIETNLDNWAPFPMICSFLVAALCSIFKKKDFSKAFSWYLGSFILTVALIFAPISSADISFFIIPFLSVCVVISTIVSTVINRQLPNVMFLCSVLSLVAVEITRNQVDLNSDLTIFWYVLSHVFLFLVFFTSRNSTSHDITPFFSLQKKLEITQKELESSKQRLVKVENIFSASPHPILVIDLDQKIVECNRATKKLYGFDVGEEISGLSYMRFVSRNDEIRVKELLQRVLDVGTITNVEFNAVDCGGVEFAAELSVSKIMDSLGFPSGFVIITDDISERKLMEDELRRHTEELALLVDERTRALKESHKKLVRTEKLAAVGQAATMVGHDLRNPLQAISNGVYLLKKAVSRDELPDNVEKAIYAVSNAVEYADNIVKNLQDFTKIKEPIFDVIDVDSLILDVFSLVAKPDNVTIVFEPVSLLKVDLDKDMIKRVFVNLVSNAIQAMSEGGGTLTVNVKVVGESVKISFKDTGVGISEGTKKRLFTAFFTTKAQGMGVGLAICKRFIELHSGSIEVESTEGEGAEFIVSLPIKQQKFMEKRKKGNW